MTYLSSCLIVDFNLSDFINFTEEVRYLAQKRDSDLKFQVLRGDSAQTWSAAEGLEAPLVRVGQNQASGEPFGGDALSQPRRRASAFNVRVPHS